MNLFLSCVGRRGYIADFFRPHLGSDGRIYGSSNHPHTPGFAHCDSSYLMPDIDSASYVDTVLALCSELRVGGILSLFDPDIHALAPHKERFAATGCFPVLPSSEASGLFFDKMRTVGFLRDAGLRAPVTISALAEAVSAISSREIAFPLVVKPRMGFGSSHVHVVRSPEQLAASWTMVPNPVVQELLSGEEFHLDIFVDTDGEVCAVVPKRKLAMRAGETDQAQTVGDTALLELGVLVGSAAGRCGHLGPLDVDVFVAGGEAVVLELNPRFGGGYPLSHLAGVDFPALVLKMIRGEKVPARVGDYERGVTVMKEYRFIGGADLQFLGAVTDLRRTGV